MKNNESYGVTISTKEYSGFDCSEFDEEGNDFTISVCGTGTEGYLSGDILGVGFIISNPTGNGLLTIDFTKKEALKLAQSLLNYANSIED